MTHNSRHKKVRLLTIGSVSPMNGGMTQGGVATQHSMINQEFVENDGLDVELVGTIATNTNASKDTITGVPYFQRREGESVLDCLTRVIHVTSPDVILLRHISNAWGASLSKIRDRPKCVGFVHSVNAIDPNLNPNHLSKKQLAIQALDAVDALVFNSPHSFSRAKRQILNDRDHCPVHIIPPSAKLDFHHPVVLNGHVKRKILFVGKLDANKRIMELLDAVTEHRAYELIVTGDGPLKDQVLTHIHQNPSNNISHHENLNSVELAHVLAECGLLCVPSQYESFGLVYIEALCMGVPVLGFEDSINFINQCLGMECGLPVADSVRETLAAAIDRMENRFWDRLELSKKARYFFEPYRHAEELAALFQDLQNP